MVKKQKKTSVFVACRKVGTVPAKRELFFKRTKRNKKPLTNKKGVEDYVENDRYIALGSVA